MEDKLLQNCIPRLYHQEEFTPFVQAIDRAITGLEGEIEKIPAMLDVDSCPDFALPYLAALTKCPLWGQSPLLWRKQIKNWPHVCRMKGTKKALRYFFDSLGIVAETIETYWRDSAGEYVVERPEGVPYLDNSGLWYNSKTHYFGVILSANEEDITNLPNADLRVVSKNILEWMELVKPFHAELLRIAWMVQIFHKWEIHHRAECQQTVDAYQKFWNLGSVRSARRDGEFLRDGIIRRTGRHPVGQYREQQAHRLEVDMQVDTVMNGSRIVNRRDGTHCRDGSHRRSGTHATGGMVSHACTVSYIKNGIEVIEYV